MKQRKYYEYDCFCPNIDKSRGLHIETHYSLAGRQRLLAWMTPERVAPIPHSVPEPEEFLPARVRYGKQGPESTADWSNPFPFYASRLVINSAFSPYSERISVLRQQARQEGYAINTASEVAFWKFFFAVPNIRRGRLVLLENGNLRAVWKGDNQAHIGLQFLDEQLVQYVLFARREPRLPVSRVTGRDTIKGVRMQINAFGLAQVLCE